jgi:hypothetical protein
LLAAREGRTRRIEFILDFVPKCRTAQGIFNAIANFATGHFKVEAQRVSNVIEDAHRKWRRLLENHTNATTQLQQVHIGRENILSIEKDFAFCPLAAMKLVNAIVDAQMR